MAKEKRHQPSEKATKKVADSKNMGASSGPFLSNFIIILVLSILFFGIYELNGSYAQLRDLYYEKQAIESSPNGNEQRLDEINRRVHEIQCDTGFVKTLFFGYFYDVHSVAIEGPDQLDRAITDIKEEKSKFGLDNTGPITREDKLANKVHTYRLLDFVNTSCPPNSVILLPPADSLSKDPKWNFIYDPMWVEYFIYPRLCVETGAEAQTPGLANRITHVLIVKGIGYDKLKYSVPVDKREPLCLLPINKPADTTQISN